jgi:hypothetical protein
MCVFMNTSLGLRRGVMGTCMQAASAGLFDRAGGDESSSESDISDKEDEPGGDHPGGTGRHDSGEAAESSILAVLVSRFPCSYLRCEQQDLARRMR